MSQHLIIDGYNLLGVAGRLGGGHLQAGETGREALLQELMLYRQRVGHPMTVVFDAWRQTGGTQRQEHRSGMTVVFSRQGELADQVIQKMVREHGQNCVVVSSDHEVINTARAHGVMVIRSQDFWPKVRRSSHPSTSRSFVKSDDEEDGRSSMRPEKKGNPRKLPKAVRNRLRRLKKF